MTPKPNTAFILAAGLGTRLRPYTDTLPKPMVSVAGKPIIDHIIDKLIPAEINKIVVNTHHMGGVLKKHLSQRQDVEIIFSEEEELLDTGGGVKKALPELGKKPFYIINGDAFWTDDIGHNAFENLNNIWDDGQCDMVLLLEPAERMTLTKGVGDYDILENNKAVRSLNQNGKYMFAGVRLCHPRIFEEAKENKFSFLKLMDEADKAGRLYGCVHKGYWHHISTPEELHAVDEAVTVST